MFNLFIEKKYITNEFKHAHIVPIYKNSGSELDTNNYRPISYFKFTNSPYTMMDFYPWF